MAHCPALRLLVLLFALPFARLVNASQCAPPAGFHDGPHPVIAAPDQLASHTEVIDIPATIPGRIGRDEQTAREDHQQVGLSPRSVGRLHADAR